MVTIKILYTCTERIRINVHVHYFVWKSVISCICYWLQTCRLWCRGWHSSNTLGDIRRYGMATEEHSQKVWWQTSPTDRTLQCTTSPTEFKCSHLSQFQRTQTRITMIYIGLYVSNLFIDQYSYKERNLLWIIKLKHYQ